MAGNTTSPENYDLSVYPNPTSGALSIQLNGLEMPEEDLIRLEVFTIAGRSVMETNMQAVLLAEGISYDVSFLDKGVYIVRVSGRNLVLNKSLVRN